MSVVELKKSHRKLHKTIEKALRMSTTLAGDSLAVDPLICKELGLVGRRLKDAMHTLETIEKKRLPESSSD